MLNLQLVACNLVIQHQSCFQQFLVGEEAPFHRVACNLDLVPCRLGLVDIALEVEFGANIPEMAAYLDQLYGGPY